MKTKKIIALLLAAVMLFALTACAQKPQTGAPKAEEPKAEDPKAEEEVPVATFMSDIDAQISLILSRMDDMKQEESGLPWYYTVVDLDHDGNVEFLAASQHPQDRSTNLKMWEVGEDRASLKECELQKEDDESFPDIARDGADAYYVESTDTWHYVFNDYVVLSDEEVYAIKSSFNLKDGKVSYDAYAVEHAVVENGKRIIEHTDMQGNPITAEQYNKAELETFRGAERGSINFEWLTADSINNLEDLNNSFEVFMGLRKQSERYPVPQPNALKYPEGEKEPAPAPSAAPKPTPTPVPAPKPQTYLYITKNPTNESKRSADTAYFVACANVYDSLAWTFVAPNGKAYTPNDFGRAYGARIEGSNSTTLKVNNVSYDMNGFGVYCTFYYKGQTARTSTALLWVSNPTPTPPPTVVPAQPANDSGEYKGTVTDYSYSTITVQVGGGNVCYVPRTVCMVVGDIYIGAPAVVCWTKTNGSVSYTYCEVEGEIHEEETPVLGTMKGLAYNDDNDQTVYLLLNNGCGYHISREYVKILGGTEIEGASCTAYYENEPTQESIYYVEIDGYDAQKQEPEEEYDYGDPFEGINAWICPVCGESNQEVTVCWCCQYEQGTSVEDYWKAHQPQEGDPSGWDTQKYDVPEQPQNPPVVEQPPVPESVPEQPQEEPPAPPVEEPPAPPVEEPPAPPVEEPPAPEVPDPVVQQDVEPENQEPEMEPPAEG